MDLAHRRKQVQVMTPDVAVDPAVGVIARKLTDQLAGHNDTGRNGWARAALAEASTVKVRGQKVISRAEHRSDKVVQGHRAGVLGIAHVLATTNTEAPDAMPVPFQKNPHMP